MDKAFIFDLNGTMIDDMPFHINAWHHILNEELGANLTKEQVKSQMYGKNSELLVRVFGEHRFSKKEMDHLSVEKEKRYQREYRPHLQLIPGLMEFLKKAHTLKIPLAIGSAAIQFNIDFVLDNLGIRHFFKAIVSADDVNYSKPNPETYIKAAGILGIQAKNCIVFEDAPKGVEAALSAGMQSVVITLLHQSAEFSVYDNVIRYIGNYTEIAPGDLL